MRHGKSRHNRTEAQRRFFHLRSFHHERHNRTLCQTGFVVVVFNHPPATHSNIPIYR